MEDVRARARARVRVWKCGMCLPRHGREGSRIEALASSQMRRSSPNAQRPTSPAQRPHPDARASIVVCVVDESARLAISHCLRSRWSARRSSLTASGLPACDGRDRDDVVAVSGLERVLTTRNDSAPRRPAARG